RYTYGKPVQGKVQASLCQPYSPLDRGDPPIEKNCIEVGGQVSTAGVCGYHGDGPSPGLLLMGLSLSLQTKKNGCFSTQVLLAAFNLTSSIYQKQLQVQASLVEDGTGLELKNTKTCKILPEILTVTFENTDDFYKPGIPYTGMMLLKGADGSVLPQRQLLLVITQRGKDTTRTLLTDRLGRASFELETSDWSGTVTLRGQVNETADTQNGGSTLIYQKAYTFLRSFFSASKSFLRIRRLEGELPCGQPQQLWVDFIFSKEALGTQLESLDVVFLVLAKGTIVTVLRKELPAEAGLRGSFFLELPIGLKLAPTARVLGYALLPSGEMVADSTELKVDKCFPSKVKMAFSEDRTLPGSALQLELDAAPGSLCAVRAVDRSVLLLKPEAELNAEAVYKVLPEFDYPGSIQDPPLCSESSWDYFHDFDIPINPSVPRKRDPFYFLRRHRLPLYSGRNSQMDTYKLFQNAALKLFTNAKTNDVCKRRFSLPMMHGPLGPRGQRGPCDRTTFDGGYLWKETHVPKVMFRRMPDIAVQEEPPAPRTYFPETWLWDLVPVGEGGSAEMTVTVPDAITEWEAGMFCMSPQGLGLAPATTLTAFKPFFVELALPYAVVRHEAFTLVATVFNYLQQCLRVQVTLVESAELEVSASGDEVYGGCICADEARTFRWGVRATSLGEVNITVTTEALSSEELCSNEMPVVPAQGRMDTVIKPLLVQPGGILVEKAHNSLLCQEVAEEISLEVPANILEGSQRAHVTVMGDIMGNALQNLDRLLAMPHGCGEQNMVHFAPNIYIQQYLEKSGQLHPDIRARAQGFLQSGDPCTSGMAWLDPSPLSPLQGGVSDELSLSAYVTAAMLELGLSPTHPTVSSALRCLEAAATDDPYTQALLAYVLGLAGRVEQQQTQLQSLAQHSVSAEGQLHWQRKGKALPPSQPSWAAAAPAEVEMTAYVLLAYLSQPQVSSADMGTASQIVRWLSKQQNPYGGFASTQDTVVALQALAKYAALTYGNNGDLAVTVTSPTGTAQDFVLNNSNRLGLGLPPGFVGAGRSQGGRVDPNPNPALGLCPVRYTGDRPATNMVVIEAKLPSGYIPDKSSVVQLKEQKLVKKVEVEPEQVTIYLDQLTKEEETLTFTARQDFLVRNLQPATVTLYDYYETGE
ncbi:A2ML1 protein, partial [Columbina picui]|nr:A2ML1 protein [Columbina picui]